jgi:hypothetical protein
MAAMPSRLRSTTEVNDGNTLLQQTKSNSTPPVTPSRPTAISGRGTTSGSVTSVVWFCVSAFLRVQDADQELAEFQKKLADLLNAVEQ